ncbi:biopolymer transporter ExbD [soil metagenome]
MAFGSFKGHGDSAPMAEINVIPLVDIMLVLLVIFIVTAPLLTNSVKIELPKASSAVNITKPDNVQIAIKADGSMFWNGEAVQRAELTTRLVATGKRDPVPELHLHADKQARYQSIAEVMADAANAGVTKIGFVSEPVPQ